MKSFNNLDLRQLAELESAEKAFVSLYLCPPDDTGWLDKRAQRLADLLADEPEQLEHFEAGLASIREWLAEHSTNSEAVCVFSCFALGFVRGFTLPVSMPARLRLGAGPMISPLAELQDEYENFIFVVVDNTVARIRVVSSALIRARERIRGDIKQHVKKGGWSQKRYQRKRANALKDYSSEVAARLAELAAEKNCGRIVLLGSEETRQAILDELDEAVLDKIVADEPTDVKQTEDELLAEAYDLYFEAEREDELSLWEQIKEEDYNEGLATVGPRETWFALANGRADAVAVNRELDLPATRCRDCENLTPHDADTCEFCQSEDVFAVSLLEACVRQAEMTGAEIDFMDPPLGLTKVGGIAALLRY